MDFKQIQQVRDRLEMNMDRLTGLLGEIYFVQKAPDWIKEYLEEGHTVHIVFFDIVGMKLYNAQNGYSQGDKLIHDVADLLRSVFDGKPVSRFDADHFCVLSDDENIVELIGKINDQMENIGAIRVEINAGIRQVKDGDEINITKLIDEAKMACDVIHHDAEHTYRFYDDELEKQLQDQKFVNDHIDQAIAGGEIVVYYQPVVRTLDRKLCGYEALARWISPELGFLAPYRFIPALESSHQIHKLDCQVIEQICRQYREDVDAGIPVVPVSFNLSRLDFQMCDIFEFIQETTAKYNVPHSMMHVEITETTFSEDDGLIRNAISKFHDAGYEVWMDDFGSGYSSLNSLKDYTFDQLKIDMEFLKSFSEKSQKIITSMVQMAKSIGIHTLAEGVENEEHYEFLRSIGCEKVQGYYFGKPLPLRQSLAQVTEKGITEESAIDAEFYSEAGISLVATHDPFAVMEYDGNNIKYLYMNKGYMGVLHKIGFESPDSVINELGGDGNRNAIFKERLSQALAENGYFQFAVKMHEHFVTMSIQVLNQQDGRICFKQGLSQIVIDAQTKEQEQAPINVATVQTQPKETILIADDEPINYMILFELLKSHYNILYADNGQKVLDLLDEHRTSIAAVLLDMVMPVMDGMQVLHKMRSDSVTRFIPVIVMTAATEMQKDVLEAGASSFLPKPYESPEIIVAKIDNEITKSKMVRNYSFKSMEYIPGGLFVYKADESQSILFANHRTLEIFGCDTLEEFMELSSASFKGIVHPDDYDRVMSEISEQMHQNDHNRDHVSYRIKTKEGNIVTIDEFGQIVEDEMLGRVFYVFIGETEQK